MYDTVAAETVREQRFTRWVAEYGESILRMCIMYLKNISDAEDAAQDTLLKAWKAMEQFEKRNGASEKSWLMSIAVNTCHDYFRSRWFRNTNLEKALEDLPQRYLRVEAKDITLTMDVMRLREPLKQVILLYYYQNMTLQDVGYALNITPSTVHRRLRQAEKILKTSITGEEEKDGQ